LQQYDQPEILRTSLDSTILLLLTLHKSKWGIFSSPSESLGQLLSPPLQEDITQSYISLHASGCILCPPKDHPVPGVNADGVVLTSLGEFLQNLPFDVTVGKMVAIGALFEKYMPFTIIMATAASVPEVFFRPNFFQGNARYITDMGHNQERRMYFDNGNFSDMLSVIQIYSEYKEVKKSQQLNWCRKKWYSFSTFEGIRDCCDPSCPEDCTAVYSFLKNAKPVMQRRSSLAFA